MPVYNNFFTFTVALFANSSEVLVNLCFRLKYSLISYLLLPANAIKTRLQNSLSIRFFVITLGTSHIYFLTISLQAIILKDAIKLTYTSFCITTFCLQNILYLCNHHLTSLWHPVTIFPHNQEAELTCNLRRLSQRS